MNLFFWAFVTIALLVLEGATMQLLSIWFSVGALAAFFATLMDLNLTGQLVVFTAVSIVLLLVTRPLLKKIKVQEPLKTGASTHEGKCATVIEEIDNSAGTGRVTLEDTYWKAISINGVVIPKGSIVSVVRLEGTKLYVLPIENNN